MPRHHDPDPVLPPLAVMDQANAAGLTRHQVRQRVRASMWLPIARGSYAPDGERLFDGLDEHGRARMVHVQRAVAAAIRNPGAVVTDASAALVHGLPTLHIPDNVQLAVSAQRWSGTRSGIDFRTRNFHEGEIVEGRVPVASPERCWVDITRFGSLAHSLVTGDSALRNGLINGDPTLIDVQRWRGQRGYRRLSRALDLLDGARESPLESSSFAYFVEHQLPTPLMQVEIRSRASGFIARVDFLWKAARVVGEADGLLKYADREAIYAEKRREDFLRSEGYTVVRWGWADLRTLALARRLRRLLT